MHHLVLLAEVGHVHTSGIYSRQRYVETLHRLDIHREVAIDIGSARHIAHRSHLRVFAPCGQLIIAASLKGETSLNEEVGTMGCLGVEVDSIHLCPTAIATLLHCIAIRIHTNVLQIEHVGKGCMESLGKDIKLEMTAIQSPIHRTAETIGILGLQSVGKTDDDTLATHCRHVEVLVIGLGSTESR